MLYAYYFVGHNTKREEEPVISGIRNMEITKDITIGELLNIDTGVIPILMNIGMHCVGCPASQGESIEEAALVHGLDPEELVNQINAYLAGAKAE